nr:MAG TPA: hypothetical protein [Bacteriophage sp.]
MRYFSHWNYSSTITFYLYSFNLQFNIFIIFFCN